MRSWDTYTGLEATIKNTLTSLKAVGELQNSAIRQRHWNQLMCSTKNLAALPPEFIVSIQFSACLVLFLAEDPTTILWENWGYAVGLDLV
ncbi:hypothetical protein NQ315_013775 [Exocentrus adspersus]|uniref:Dynein heavy chain linker domain-containing protein n=1 Tax=Exocentrus adspersus TaxID=1586481 RepID=A0AAV8W3S9_9CUCU|nr:hypothetical protein NQ315_013775 [Exocentrus adspersus]